MARCAKCNTVYTTASCPRCADTARQGGAAGGIRAPVKPSPKSQNWLSSGVGWVVSGFQRPIRERRPPPASPPADAPMPASLPSTLGVVAWTPRAAARPTPIAPEPTPVAPLPLEVAAPRRPMLRYVIIAIGLAAGAAVGLYFF